MEARILFFLSMSTSHLSYSILQRTIISFGTYPYCNRVLCFHYAVIDDVLNFQRHHLRQADIICCSGHPLKKTLYFKEEKNFQYSRVQCTQSALHIS